MVEGLGDGLAGWMEQRLIRRWTDAADIPELSPEDRARAVALRDGVSRALLASDRRRAANLAARSVPATVSPYSDWTWRPDLWRGAAAVTGWSAMSGETVLTPDVQVFHDCPLGEISLRQLRSEEGPPYALSLDVYRFRGSYLSVVVALPPDAVDGLRRRHVIRVDLRMVTERQTAVYARLNILHGPNTARIVREVPMHDPAPHVDFDLAATRIDTARTERMWLDLILDSADMNAVRLGEMFLSRMPRAEL
jgi:hypothetical protein